MNGGEERKRVARGVERPKVVWRKDLMLHILLFSSLFKSKNSKCRLPERLHRLLPFCQSLCCCYLSWIVIGWNGRYFLLILILYFVKER